MESLKEIKELIMGTEGKYGLFVDKMGARMHLVSVLYRAVYDLENYWRSRTGVSGITFKPKALSFLNVADHPALGWEFKLNEEEKELQCINHLSVGDARSTRVNIPLAYFEDRDKYLESVNIETLNYAREKLKKQAKMNEKKLKLIEEQLVKDAESLSKVNEMLRNNGKQEDELF